MRGSRQLAVSCCVILAACSAEVQHEQGPPVTQDSAGVTIIRSAGGGSGLDWRLGPEAVLEIGRESRSINTAFQHIGLAGFAPDGTIFVVDMNAPRVARFDTMGAFLGTLGAPGEGPGEYRIPGPVFFAEDTIFMAGAIPRNLHFYPEDGAPGTWRLPLAIINPEIGEGRMPAHRGRRVWSRLPDGRFLVEGNATLPAQVGPAVEQVMLAIWVPGSSALDTILELPGARREVVRERGRLEIRDPHFAGQYLIGVRRSEVHYSDGRSFSIDTYSTDGSLVRRAVVDRPLQPVTDEVENEYRRHLSSLWEQGILEGVEPGRLAEQFDATPFADSIPPFSQLIVDQLGFVWAAEYWPSPFDDDPTAYHVFDPAGAYLGVIQVPGRLVVHDATADRVLGVHTDELDVQSIRVYELDR